MFGTEIDGNGDSSEDEGRQSRRNQRRGRQPNDKWNSLLASDSDQESTEDGGSECEWEDWGTDLTSCRKRRHTSPPDSGVQWESSWQWGSDTSSKKGLDLSTPINLDDYDFPAAPATATGAAVIANLGSLDVPPRTLSSYASEDSLLKRSLQSNSLRRHRTRPESPSSYLSRSRPRSPLAGELDDADYYGLEPGLAVPSPPQLMPEVAYPSRRTSNETGMRQAGGPGHLGQRVPMAMAMTTITSTVTAGNDPSSNKKNKGKGKAKAAETPPKPPRKRSLTVQGTLPPRPSMTDSLRDSPGTSTLSTPESAEKPSKPGKLKLALSFAQVAAMGSESGGPSSTPRGLAPPPLSATSVSSFESPRFAHPEDSD